MEKNSPWQMERASDSDVKLGSSSAINTNSLFFLHLGKSRSSHSSECIAILLLCSASSVFYDSQLLALASSPLALPDSIGSQSRCKASGNWHFIVAHDTTYQIETSIFSSTLRTRNFTHLFPIQPNWIN